MDLRPENEKTVVELIKKGVEIPNPLSIHVGEGVRVSQISGRGVRIYPGCRIYGRDTVISANARIGSEGPVTIENCQIGPRVELKGGYFKKAVFLERASMGSGAHVREGCIVEERASGAHCVGLKQTILFPFVTLGSLINFCDCLMAGGTSRMNHSEVGSSYIHFNFTADGDKATASLFGDVPRGVMLNQPPIFLGGQGGAVGPLRLAYGSVAIAGTVLRKDVTEENRMIIGKSYRGGLIPFVSGLYTGLSHMVENNIIYLANLAALEQWYIHVRQETFRAHEFGDLIFRGALDKLTLAREERIRRLGAVAEKMPESLEKQEKKGRAAEAREEFHRKFHLAEELFRSDMASRIGAEHRDPFVEGFMNRMKQDGGDYLSLVQGLSAHLSQGGTLWLESIVHGLCRKTAGIFPSMNLFRRLTSTPQGEKTETHG
ncbi:MAG: UDP-N-acetylglucosamine pyrophosphorylase [Deltaproteobacteria bacterium]|nr:UDP-N-acetylglucosamine pyrophosphorylase [Deltaproteobacteria bacterium]